MLVLIDTNVLDVLEKREAFYESSNHVLSLCASKKISGCIALHSISNIFYILRKIYSAENRRRLLLGILKFLRVADVSHENVRHALEMASLIMRIACRMNVLHKTTQTISSPGILTIFQTQTYLQSHHRIF